MDEFTRYLLTVAVPATIGFVGWCVNSIVRLRNEVSALRLHVAENYPKMKDMEEIKNELTGLTKIIYSIAGKLGVPTKD